jgi:hypothetical protein
MILTLSSAKGSPGVTTTALLVTLAWPRPVLLIESDPSGGSVAAGYLSGDLPHVDTSVVELALAQRRGETIDAANLRDSAIPLAGDARFIVGSPGPGQAGFCAPLWEPMADAARLLSLKGFDIVVDLGRISAETQPWLRAADLSLLVTRTTMPALAAAQSAAASMRASAGPRSVVEVLTIGINEPYGSTEIEDALNLHVTASIANDPVTAEAFSLGRAHRSSLKDQQIQDSRLLRSTQRALEAVMAHRTETVTGLGEVVNV